MKIELLMIGKTKEPYIASGIDDFSKRLGHHTPVTLTYLKTRRMTGKNSDEARIYESTLINERLRPGDYRVALDVAGKMFSSEQWAAYLGDLIDRGIKQTVFVIGGPVGLAEEQLRSADLVMSLSRMTFTHDMARLLLLEQLYRTYTIRAGTGYHK